MYINGQYLSNSINTTANPIVNNMPLRLGVDRESMSNPFFGHMDQILLIKSAKYRGNFIPSEYTQTKDCNCGGYSYSHSQFESINKYISWE